MSTPLSMRGTMFRLKTAVFIFTFVTLGIAQKTCSTQTQAESPKPSGNVRFNPDLLDKDIDPCTDFYAYACTKSPAQNPIPRARPGRRRCNELPAPAVQRHRVIV